MMIKPSFVSLKGSIECRRFPIWPAHFYDIITQNSLFITELVIHNCTRVYCYKEDAKSSLKRSISIIITCKKDTVASYAIRQPVLPCHRLFAAHIFSEAIFTARIVCAPNSEIRSVFPSGLTASSRGNAEVGICGKFT
jgi:hypothetical protein